MVPRPVRPLDERGVRFKGPTDDRHDRANQGHDERDRLPKAYRPADFEGAIYERWLAADVFAPDGRAPARTTRMPPFTLIQPPPNITGSLHIGHAQRTVEDLMVRHARMTGRPTLFLPGLDHASIAAQVVLDRIIAKDGETPVARPRAVPRADAGVRRRDARGDARQQRRVGGSCGRRLRYDGRRWPGGPEAFTRLYRDGLAYRAEG